MNVALIVLNSIGALIVGVVLDRTFASVARRVREGWAPAGLAPLRNLIFPRRAALDERARHRLAESIFVGTGETPKALFRLMDRASPSGQASPTVNPVTHELRAICGFKGNYSDEYYRSNFTRCRKVVRVFSYEAIKAEFRAKGEHYALDGLKLHLSPPPGTQCEIQVCLIKPGKRINDACGESFDPPHSFGLAMLLDQDGSAVEAVSHWEIEVAGLKDVLSIEGIVLGPRQAATLDDLLSLHSTIVKSNVVWCSRDPQHRKSNEDAVKQLEQEWLTYVSTKAGVP